MKMGKPSPSIVKEFARLEKEKFFLHKSVRELEVLTRMSGDRDAI